MTSVTEEDDKRLPKGSEIPGGKDPDRIWIVEKELGAGGFGAVYLVRSKNKEEAPGRKYAMKAEIKKEARKHRKLTMEVMVLNEVHKQQGPGAKHDDVRPRTRGLSTWEGSVEYGRDVGDTFFLVMEVVGESLDKLRRKRPNKVFSIGTALITAKQLLEAVEHLHMCKFLHRDIKPENAAVGTGEKRRLVYILDFGLARKFIKDNGELKTPRHIVGMKGTERYASRNCLKGCEQGRQDDLETWFYTVFEIMMPEGLPWRRMEGKDAVLSAKETFFEPESQRNLFSNSPTIKKHFAFIMDYLGTLKYFDEPDYDFILKNIDKAMRKSGVDKRSPLDWEAPSTA